MNFFRGAARRCAAAARGWGGAAPAPLMRAHHGCATGLLRGGAVHGGRQAAVSKPRVVWGLHPGFAAGFSSNQSPKGRAISGGPVGYASLALVMVVGVGAVTFYKQEKERLMTEVVGGNRTVGKADLGGPFELVNAEDGKTVTDRDFHGQHVLIYFGFTTCPDICPDELEKVAAAIDIVEKSCGEKILPLFISIDPERDSVEKVKEYCAEFHPRLVGLTGSVEQCKNAARKYRVYASKTGGGDDYLVDHSIIHYLVDPQGNFVTFYGKNHTAEEMAVQMCKDCGRSGGGKKWGFF